MRLRLLASFVAVAAAAALAGCPAGPPAPDMMVPLPDDAGVMGGPIATNATTHPGDTHCEGDAPIVATVTSAACAAPDGGAAQPAPPRWGASAADDDCKYDVSLTSVGVYRGYPAYLTILLTSRTDGTAVTGAAPHASASLDGAPLAQTQTITVAETPVGTYTAGPFYFTSAGTWVVDWILFPTCLPGNGSPRGHVAFNFNVN